MHIQWLDNAAIDLHIFSGSGKRQCTDLHSILHNPQIAVTIVANRNKWTNTQMSLDKQHMSNATALKFKHGWTHRTIDASKRPESKKNIRKGRLIGCTLSTQQGEGSDA